MQESLLQVVSFFQPLKLFLPGPSLSFQGVDTRPSPTKQPWRRLPTEVSMCVSCSGFHTCPSLSFLTHRSPLSLTQACAELAAPMTLQTPAHGSGLQREGSQVLAPPGRLWPTPGPSDKLWHLQILPPLLVPSLEDKTGEKREPPAIVTV